MRQKDSGFPARYWHRVGDDTVECELCPHHCRLAEGKRGRCFVRKNISGQMILTTYGRSSGFCIDPIEKKPLYHFYPGSSALSFGTAGCNLTCRFCQNWDISKAREFDRLTEKALPVEIAERAKQEGAESVAFTYNEPIIFAEYAIDTAEACHRVGVHSVCVTAGYISASARAGFFSKMDAANVDLKSFSDDFYKRLCGGSLQPVLDTLVYLKKETDVWLEITTLLIPGENDSERELHEMSEWVVQNLGSEVPWHFSAFHPAFQYLGGNPTPPSTVKLARGIAKSKGMKHVYTGNIHDSEGGNTYCSSCGVLLIERDRYEIRSYNLKDGTVCPECGEKAPGRFGKGPGAWGGRRRSVFFNPD